MLDQRLSIPTPAYPSPAHLPPDAKIVLFDAECALCSANAKFILDRDF